MKRMSLWAMVAAVALMPTLAAAGLFGGGTPPPPKAGILLRDVPLPKLARELGYMPTADGTLLAYVVYRPAAPGRYPTLVWFDVYGAGSMMPQSPIRSWVERGYAVVGVSARGTGCSTGQTQPFTVQDARDGAFAVDWAGAQSWSSGKVGLIGNSHPGIVQFGIAAQQPRALVAIAPGGTLARTYADFWYPGGLYNFGFAEAWSTQAQPGTSKLGADFRIHFGDEACKARKQVIGTSPLLEQVRTQPHDGDYYRQSSPYELAGQIRMPTLMVQSWTDPAVSSSALWVFEKLAVPNKRLMVVDGGHDAYLYSTAHEEVQRWMDRWLKGQANGIDTEPRVRIDFESKISAGVEVGELIPVKPGWTSRFASWPVPGTQQQTLRLNADGRLLENASALDAPPRAYRYTAGVLDNKPVSAANPTLWLNYISAPMAADTAIIGAPQLVLYVSSTAVDTDFMAVLNDIAPNGDSTYLQRGLLRASRRAVDGAASLPSLPFHPQLRDEPVQPGRVYEYRIAIWPMAHVLRKGHVLELAISAPAPIKASWWNLKLTPQIGINSIHQTEQYPSRLELPVVPELQAKTAAPACGSQLYQPCQRGGQ